METIGQGYTAVRSMTIMLDPSLGSYSLALELAKNEDLSSPSIKVKFFDISQMQIRGFGGGLTQFQLLEVENVSDHQLDRIKYVIRELENDIISFSCRKYSYDHSGPN